MKIYTSITWAWDSTRNEYVTTGEEFYESDRPVALCCGASDAQKNIGNQQTTAYNTMVQQAGKVFGNSSTVFNDLLSTFAPTVAAGPSQAGFNPAEASALKSKAITDTGNAYRNARQAVGEAQASVGGGNVADVSGGSRTATDLGLAESAANQTSSELNQIDQANYETGRKNYDTAVSGLTGSTSVFNPVAGLDNAATGGGEAAANTENQIASQNQSWVQSVTGALGGIAGGLTTGGMSNLGKGVGFFGSGAKNGNKGSN